MSNDSFKNEQIRQKCLKCLKNLNANFYRGGMACRAMDKEKTAWRMGCVAKRNRKRGKYLFLETQAVVQRYTYLERVDARDKRCECGIDCDSRNGDFSNMQSVSADTGRLSERRCKVTTKV